MNKTQLMEDNIGLMYKYYGMYKVDDDDKRQEIAYAYCKAIKNYSANNKCAISTYVFTAIDNHLHQQHYLRSMQKRTMPKDVTYFSFNQLVRYGAHDTRDEDMCYEDVVGSEDKDFDDILIEDIVARIRPKLTKKQLQVFDLLLAGNTRTEVAHKLGSSHQAVTQKLDIIREKVMRELNG